MPSMVSKSDTVVSDDTIVAEVDTKRMRKIIILIIAAYAGLCSAAPPSTQSWLQSVADSAPGPLATIRAVYAGGAEYIATPTPPAPVYTRIVQAADVFAYQQAGGDREIKKTIVTQGGIIRSTAGRKLTIIDSYSEGAPSGEAIYCVLVATGKGRELYWDNTNLANKWIISGNEAALRVMGDTEVCTIIGVDFCCRMHDNSDKGAGGFDPSEWRKTKLLPIPTIAADGSLIQPARIGQTLPSGGKAAWWKQVVQLRDIRKGSARACRFVGLVDVGAQASPTTPQKVDSFIFEACGFTDEIHFTDKKTYGTIIRRGCFKLDESGRVLKDGAGKLAMWPDQTYRGK
jgi:hypothetical protein